MGPSSHQDELTSLRFSGTGHIEDETLNIYHGYHWNNGELLLMKNEDDLSDMSNEASSFIVTGQSAWTLYPEPYYEGIAICIESHPIGDGLYSGAYSADDIGLPNNVLSSMKKGCHTTNVYKPN